MTSPLSESSSRRLEDFEWWTEADQAEWNLLIKEFFDVAWEHKHYCWLCDELVFGWCAIVIEAWNRLVGWRDARVLVSKAQWFRAREDARR